MKRRVEYGFSIPGVDEIQFNEEELLSELKEMGWNDGEHDEDFNELEKLMKNEKFNIQDTSNFANVNYLQKALANPDIDAEVNSNSDDSEAAHALLEMEQEEELRIKKEHLQPPKNDSAVPPVAPPSTEPASTSHTVETRQSQVIPSKYHEEDDDIQMEIDQVESYQYIESLEVLMWYEKQLEKRLTTLGSEKGKEDEKEEIDYELMETRHKKKGLIRQVENGSLNMESYKKMVEERLGKDEFIMAILLKDKEEAKAKKIQTRIEIARKELEQSNDESVHKNEEEQGREGKTQINSPAKVESKEDRRDKRIDAALDMLREKLLGYIEDYKDGANVWLQGGGKTHAVRLLTEAKKIKDSLEYLEKNKSSFSSLNDVKAILTNVKKLTPSIMLGISEESRKDAFMTLNKKLKSDSSALYEAAKLSIAADLKDQARIQNGWRLKLDSYVDWLQKNEKDTLMLPPEAKAVKIENKVLMKNEDVKEGILRLELHSTTEKTATDFSPMINGIVINQKSNDSNIKKLLRTSFNQVTKKKTLAEMKGYYISGNLGAITDTPISFQFKVNAPKDDGVIDTLEIPLDKYRVDSVNKWICRTKVQMSLFKPRTLSFLTGDKEVGEPLNRSLRMDAFTVSPTIAGVIVFDEALPSFQIQMKMRQTAVDAKGQRNLHTQYITFTTLQEPLPITLKGIEVKKTVPTSPTADAPVNIPTPTVPPGPAPESTKPPMTVQSFKLELGSLEDMLENPFDPCLLCSIEGLTDAIENKRYEGLFGDSEKENELIQETQERINSLTDMITTEQVSFDSYVQISKEACAQDKKLALQLKLQNRLKEAVTVLHRAKAIQAALDELPQ